ncbi:MAG TPA: hypothetical protein VM618_00270 [Acidimicrobiia bacterium]|nr:hypothetical protein [Acidimicrobiia bacterium]
MERRQPQRNGRHGDHTAARPVVFVPGVGAATGGWTLLRRHLEREGFAFTSLFPADPQHADLPHLADQLAHHVESIRALAEADEVHLVGHNIGGMVARYFVQLLGGEHATASLVTIGSPHAGTAVTQPGWGPAAAQLRRGSGILRHLEESTRPMRVRWISYFSEHDPFVNPATSAVLREPVLAADNVLVVDHPALSLVVPAFVGRSVAKRLTRIERGTDVRRAGVPGVSRLEPEGSLRVGRHAGRASRVLSQAG